MSQNNYNYRQIMYEEDVHYKTFLNDQNKNNTSPTVINDKEKNKDNKGGHKEKTDKNNIILMLFMLFN